MARRPTTRGGAETLRRYWSSGKGSIKIKWNTSGDFTRCVSSVTKYLGPRAKGYCARLHFRNTGTWPGSKANTRKR